MKNKKLFLFLFISCFVNLLSRNKILKIKNLKKNIINNENIDKKINEILIIEDDFYKKFDIKNFNKNLNKIYEFLISMFLNIEDLKIGYKNDYIKSIILSNDYEIFNEIFINLYRTLHFYSSHHFFFMKKKSSNSIYKDKLCDDIICKNLLMKNPAEYYYVISILHIQRIFNLIPTINKNTFNLLKDFQIFENKHKKLSNNFFKRTEKQEIKENERRHKGLPSLFNKALDDMNEYINNIYEPAKKEFDEKFEPLFIENFEKFKKELFERAKIFLNRT